MSDLPPAVRDYLKRHPDATAAELAGAADVDPATAAEYVEQHDGHDVDDDGYITDPGFDGSLDAIRAHYERCRPVYDALAHMGDRYPTLGFASSSGWYLTRDVTSSDLLAEGWDVKQRCKTFADWDAIMNGDLGLDKRRGREMYNITSWKAEGSLDHYVLRRWDADGGEKWKGGESPTPPYSDLVGFPFWLDYDLADKAGRASLTPREREIVEAAQRRMIELVAGLYDVPTGAVYGLDSGGGAYIYGPPESTLPITKGYLSDDPAARKLLLNDMRERMNDEWGPAAWQQVADEIDGAGDLLDPDFPQNPNRQSKAPAAIHHAHDLVVTPLRSRDPDTGLVTGDVDYTPTLVSEFSAADRDELVAWADGLTAIENPQSVEPLLRGLYPEHVDADGWRQIVDARLAELRGGASLDDDYDRPDGEATAAAGSSSTDLDRSPPTRSASNNGSREGEMPVQKARVALAHIDPNLPYPEWRNIGFALADGFDRATATELYVEWSRGDYDRRLDDGATSASWDGDARARAEAIVRNANAPGTADVTLGTLIHYAHDRDGPLGTWDGTTEIQPVTEEERVAAELADMGAL